MWIYLLCLASVDLLVISQCGRSIVKQVVVLLPEDSQTALYAARYAADAINRDASILPFYHLDLINIDSGGCGEHNHGYSQLVKTISALRNPVEVTGILGPFCGQYPGTANNDLMFRITSNFGIYHIFGSPWHTKSDSISSISLAPSNRALSSTVINLIAHLGWKRIGLIGSTYGLYPEINSHLINDVRSPVKIVSHYKLSSEFSVPNCLQELQENDITIFLLSMPLDLVYHILCYTFKYQHHLSWPKYVWIVHSHWFDDVINEYRVSSSCNFTEIKLALEGVIFLNAHFEPRQKNDTIVSGQTFNDYTAAVFSSNTTVSEQYRSNLAYDAVWTLALSLNQSINTTIKLEFDGSSGRMNVRNNMRRVAITQVSGGMPTLIGFYGNESEHMNVSLFDFLPADSLPRVEMQQHLLVLLLMAAFSLEIFIILITFLYFYFRKEPEIKATSPYLSIMAFAGIYLVLTGIEVLAFASSGRKEYVTTSLCRSTIWFFGHGEAFFLVTVLVRIVRIYRLFTYFGKPSRLWWSDVVLSVVVVALVMVVTVINTLWSVFSPPIAVTQESVKDGQVLVKTVCEYPMVNLWVSICLFYGFALRVVLLIIAFMTRKIRRQNFKDTKKINVFVFLSFILGSIFVFSSVYTHDKTWRMILDYMAIVSITVSYAVILIIPKVWPPFKRRFYCKQTQVTKKSVSQQKISQLTPPLSH